MASLNSRIIINELTRSYMLLFYASPSKPIHIKKLVIFIFCILVCVFFFLIFLVLLREFRSYIKFEVHELLFVFCVTQSLKVIVTFFFTDKYH